MDISSRVLITGTSGMVGGALLRQLRTLGYTDLLAPTRAELDLTNAQAVLQYVTSTRPAYVFMVAAKVGGIAANQASPVEFLTANLQMTVNMFEALEAHPPKKSLFFGSSCIYPRECAQPMREESLLAGPLEPTNEGYALAKIVGLKLAQYHAAQYGLKTVCPMVCNIYGTGDHFEPEKSHVLSALVKRFADAKASGAASVRLWGTGAAKREFIHVDDVVAAVLFLMEHSESSEWINVGTGTDVTIRELAETIAQEIGFQGTIEWDPSKPDGMPRKCLDISKLSAMGFRAKISLREGIRKTISEYRALKTGGQR